jgi:tetratricopeptide (TPR) repeat protein
MPRKRASQLQLDAATIRACSDLLRQLDSSNRLRSNPLVARLQAGADRDGLARAVESALRRLSPRQRGIVVRCDVGSEPYAAVAASLHVSERHLFRERRAALSLIAQALLNGESSSSPATVTLVPDALETRIATAESLADRGAWREAAEMLERVAEELPAERRGPLEVRLARVYQDVENIPLARKHLDAARELAVRFADGQEWQLAEADIALAAVSAVSGNWIGADAIAARGVGQLRGWLDQSTDARIPRALVDGLVIQAEIADSRGDDKALTFSSQAYDVMAGTDAVDDRSAIGARSVAAMTFINRAKDLQRSEDILWDCYRAALSRGMTRGSLVIAANLAAHYRLTGRPAEAVRLLNPLVGAARVAGNGWVQAGVLCQLVCANLTTGALVPAAAHLAELSKAAAGNPITQALVDLTQARIELAKADFGRAFRSAVSAETGYAKVGMRPMAGTALRIQAEALADLGRGEEALRAITLAIDAIKETGHPHRLATAYLLMARIGGRPQYAIAARRLFRETQATR